MDPRLEKAVFVVEATSDEELLLWEKWSREAYNLGYGPHRGWLGDSKDMLRYERHTWIQDRNGLFAQVGTLADFPVNLCIAWATIRDQLVLFWEPVSRVVDYELCEKWLAEHVPAYARRDRCNVANFGHCLNFLKEQDT